MIYIVEDDTNIRELEIYSLQSGGFDAIGFSNAVDFFTACKKSVPSCVILDIMLPNEDGLSILKHLRSDDRTKDIPIMMVTAKTTELDMVKGLNLGADDYICKPFGIMQLIARVKALLRRTAPNESKLYKYDDILLDDDKHIVTAGGTECELTYKEYELLKYLLINKGIVLSRDKIMENVWNFNYEGDSRTVDMHIKTLRRKIGECGNYIKTIRNVGYKIGD